MFKDFGIIDGNVLTFETEDPSMVFATHIANAWEEGEDEVVIDIATNPWDAMMSYMNLETMMDHPETDDEAADMLMKRVTLVKSSNKVVMEDLRSLTDAEVCVCYESDFMPCHTFGDRLHQDYNRTPPACQAATGQEPRAPVAF